MNRRRLTRLSGLGPCWGVALWLALLVWPCLASASVWRNPKITDLVVTGTDRLLNLDFDEADEVFVRLGDLDGTNLLSPFYRAYVRLARNEEREATRKEMDDFLAAMRGVTSSAEQQLTRAPDDADLLLFLGMAWGSKAMIDGLRGNYLSALEAIKLTRQYFERCLQHQPTRHDVYYGLGLYDYTLSRVSWFFRPIVRLVLPSGDRDRGLQELILASERGTATKMLAKFALLQTYAGLEKDYRRALPLAEELLRRFPGNPELYFQAALIYSELGRSAEALEVGRQIRVNLDEHRHHFKPEMRPRYLQLMGKVYMDLGEYSTAMAFFRKTIEQPSTRYEWVTAWAWTRSGMIHDLLGQREEAMKSYRMALAVETDGIAKDFARQYLSQPYRTEAASRTVPGSDARKREQPVP